VGFCSPFAKFNLPLDSGTIEKMSAFRSVERLPFEFSRVEVARQSQIMQDESSPGFNFSASNQEKKVETAV
jgi:hypothetical protein